MHSIQGIKMRVRFEENLVIKIIAVIIALFIWLFVRYFAKETGLHDQPRQGIYDIGL